MLKRSRQWAEFVKLVHPELHQVGTEHEMFSLNVPKAFREWFSAHAVPQDGAMLNRKDVVRSFADFCGDEQSGKAIIPLFRELAGYPDEHRDTRDRFFIGWRLES